jgi:hypothetical protein
MTMFDSPEALAAALQAQPVRTGRQLRGVMAKRLDAAAEEARSIDAGRSPTGMGGSTATIRARMSASIGSRGGDRQVGFVLGDGPGLFYREHGSGHRPPDPQIRPAVERQVGALMDEVAKIATDL